MAVLCFVEWSLTSIVIYGLMVSAADSDALRSLPHASMGNLSVMLALTVGAIAVVIGLYRPAVCLERRRLLVNVGIAGILAFPALLLVSGFLHVDLSVGYLLWLAKGLIGWIGCLFLARWIFSVGMRHRIFVRRIVVLGSGDGAVRTREQIARHTDKSFEIVDLSRVMPIPAAVRPVMQNLQVGAGEDRLWGIVVATGREPVNEPLQSGDLAASGELTASALLDLKLRGVRIFDELSFWEQHLGRINLDCVNSQWLTFADGFASSRFSQFLKRLTDILVSLLVLILTLPLMLITALLVKLDSPGPVFYRQERVGLFGRPFTLFKFRSMSVDAEAGGRPRWAAQQDPRVTRVGGFIRSTRIDELPQLFNVLKGEMSFVGPRPERPHFVEQLGQIIPFYHERSYVKPGITGWAQVNFPYGASVDDAKQKLSYDLYYVKNRSILLDFIIMFSTIRVILFREGAR